MPVLSIQDVTKTYPGGKTALRDLSLTIEPGVFGLLGLNGAGKSTLLNILSASLDCEEGSVQLGDVSPRLQPIDWRRHISFMPQLFDFVPNVTALEFLEQVVAFRNLSRRTYKKRIQEILEKVRLSEVSKREAHRFSRGMKQRLMIAAAFLCPVDMVLLDEPTSGLDPKERVLFRELLAEESAGRIVILSTHIVGDIERCCGRIGILADGELKFSGAPGELVQRVENNVWDVQTDSSGVEKWRKMFPVSRLYSRRGELFARIVSEECPAPEAIPAEAALEDAYIALLSPERNALEAREIE